MSTAQTTLAIVGALLLVSLAPLASAANFSSPSVAIAPNPAHRGVAVNYSATFNNNGCGSPTLTWTWGDGTTSTTTTTTASRTFSALGNHSGSVTVSGAGCASKSTTFTTSIVNRVPSVSLASVVGAVAGEAFSLSATGSDLDGSVVRYVFRVDGVQVADGAQSVASATLTASGPHSASVVAYDNDGAASTVTTVDFTVSPAALHRVVASGDASDIVAGDARTFAAAGYDAYGNPVTLASNSFAWTAPTTAGPAQACSPESASVHVCVALQVVPAALDKVVVTGPETLTKGEVGTFTIVGYDAFENERGSSTFTFSSALAGVHSACGDFEGMEGCASVTVVDVTTPEIEIVGAETYEATAPAGAAIAFTVLASDPDDVDLEVACDAASGDVFAIGAHTVTCTASDAAGNVGMATYGFSVADTTAPSLVVEGDATFEAAGPEGAAVAFVATASDLVDVAPVVACDAADGDVLAVGAHVITCTATDASGNVATVQHAVSVVDTQAPTLAIAGAATYEASGPAGAAIDFAATATDVVDAAPAVVCDAAPGDVFAIGGHQVSCVATDASGNEATATYAFSVVDTTAPALELPATVTVVATSAAGAVATYAASATDLVDGAVAVDCTPASGSTFARGATTVACSATDASGNVASGSFVVDVVTQVVATFEMGKQVYNATDIANSIHGKVHVTFPGGGALQGAEVSVEIRRTPAIPTNVARSQRVGGVTDANGDVTFSADAVRSLIGEYTVIVEVHWMGATTTTTGGYAVAPTASAP